MIFVLEYVALPTGLHLHSISIGKYLQFNQFIYSRSDFVFVGSQRNAVIRTHWPLSLDSRSFEIVFEPSTCALPVQIFFIMSNMHIHIYFRAHFVNIVNVILTFSPEFPL